MTHLACIKKAHSVALDETVAAQEFHAAVFQPDMALVVFFCSSSYRLDLLGPALQQLFAGVQVVGCTTAGEIGPAGYRDHSLCGVSFSGRAFNAVSVGIHHLQQFQTDSARPLARELLNRLEGQVQNVANAHTFAMLLTDGMSVREEPLTRALQGALGQIPLLGGSAGDGGSYGSTHVYVDGQFESDGAVLTLVRTGLPFKLFMTQHFVATEERLVVTEAEVSTRTVQEINGRPAAQEYTRVLGVDVSVLDADHFAAAPLVVLVNGKNFVRSIQKVNPDGRLTFFCAIDRGIVLRLAKGADLLPNLEQAFDRIHAEMGTPQLVLACDCVLRKLELFQNHLEQTAEVVFQANNTIGFSTYGEQFHGVHVNQTLVGVAIGWEVSDV